MRLSEFKLPAGDIIVRDSEIKSFGLLGDQREGIAVYIETEDFLPMLKTAKNIAAVITVPNLSHIISELTEKRGMIISDHPKKTFYMLHNEYAVWISKGVIHKQTMIGEGTFVSERAYISGCNVCIGKNCTITDGVVINAGTTLGDNCFVGENTVIGTRGFQYYRDEEEVFYIEHIGGIKIGDRVEIFSGCSIASGLFTPTCIGSDVKIDNQVHISHSDVIGERTLIAAGVNIAGSVHIGSQCWIGIGAIISQCIKICDEAKVCAGAVVFSNVKKNAEVSGNFAVNHALHLYETKRVLRQKGP